MNSILIFLTNNYKWFLVAALILFLALVGFVTQSKKKKSNGDVPTVNTNVAPTPQAQPTVQTPVEQAPVETVSMPNMEAPTSVSNEVIEPEATPDLNVAPTMTFNDMPAPNPSESLANETVSNEVVMDPIQNNQFTEPVTSTPSVQETPTVQMPTFEVPSVETPVSASSELSQPEPTTLENVTPEPIIMPEPAIISEPTTTIEPAPAVITPSIEPTVVEPVNVQTPQPLDLNSNNNGQINGQM